MLLRHFGPAVLTALVALCSLPPAAAGGGALAVDLDLAAGAAAAGGAPSFPPCVDVRFTANGVTGQPPLDFSWLSDTLEEFAGNPVDLDTTPYSAGPHQLTLTVSNASGSAQAVAPFEIEALAAGLPSAAANPVPGLQATIDGSGSGYNEWRFDWGDGQVQPWQQACVAPTTHTYAEAGTYLVRLEVRNCLSGPLASAPLPVTVGGTNLLVTEFQAADCQFGACAFPDGQALTFLQTFSLPPALLFYDWDGDGATDEISALPVALHAYSTPGFYRPRVTAEWGSQSVVRTHPSWIHVSSNPEPYAFYDGFETGAATCWTALAGAPPGSPGPGCFGVE
jgi:PKD repeat protein